MKLSAIGGISFVVGLVLAAIVAVFASSSPPVWAIGLLAVLGLIVGLLNVQDKEVVQFLVASIAFLVSFSALSATIQQLAFGWEAIASFFSLMIVFVAPAAGIVAILTLFRMAKD